MILVLGLAVTAIVALLQQSNVKNTRQLTFDAAAAYVQEELVDAVDTRIQSFESGLNFIRATHPGPLDQYRAYFANRGATPVPDDPGFLLIEVVPADEISTLIARERELGNGDFAPFVLSSGDADRLIVTRTMQETELLGLPVTGLDLSIMDDIALFDAITTSEELAMYVVKSDDLIGLIGSGDTAGEGIDIDRYADYTAFLAAGIIGHDGELIGYSIESQQISQLLSSITASSLEGLNVELFIDEVADSIDGRISPDAPPIEEAGLRASREVTTASLNWRIEVWANDDFGPATGLFDQAWVWIVGILVTTASYAASIRRQRNRMRLDRARFELAHARTLAMTDALTGLLNRNGLVEAARRFRTDTAATVFFIDLDGFKAVNDSSGHDQGDEVLRAVASRLTAIFRSDDLVSRLGGDEFVVFTEHDDSADYVAAICDRITESISEIDERVTCSLGVASRSANERTDIKDLVRAADAAMYEAKRSGGDRFALSASSQT